MWVLQENYRSKDYIRGNIDSNLAWEVAHYLKSRSLFIKYDITLTDRNQWEEQNAVKDLEGETTEEVMEEIIYDSFWDELIVQLAEEGIEQAASENIPAEDGDDDADDENSLNVLATDSLVTDSNVSIRLAPGEGRIPLSLIRDRDSDFLSFIKIFCGERLDGADSISYFALTKSMARQFEVDSHGIYGVIV
ncbi:unnamed protein product [Mucor hiemalis]